MYDKIRSLIGCFELMSFMGLDVGEVIKDVYAELIELGYIPSDLRDEHEVADMLLVDFRYEFINEDILEFLVFHIMRSALIDMTE